MPDFDLTVVQTEFVCEWCEPSDIPVTNPETCRIKLCPHHGDVWHWPRPSLIDPMLARIAELRLVPAFTPDVTYWEQGGRTT